MIERVTGEHYGLYVQKNVLHPLGIHEMRLGKTLEEDRAPGEVTYYEKSGPGRSVFAKNLGQKVPWPYGGWCIGAMDSHGGWIASAVDLARFASAFDDPDHSPLLKPAMIATMLGRPAGAVGQKPDGTPKTSYYGCGWSVHRLKRGRVAFEHNGSLDGTSTELIHLPDNVNIAALFNTRNLSTGKGQPGPLIEGSLKKLVREVKEWPQRTIRVQE